MRRRAMTHAEFQEVLKTIPGNRLVWVALRGREYKLSGPPYPSSPPIKVREFRDRSEEPHPWDDRPVWFFMEPYSGDLALMISEERDQGDRCRPVVVTGWTRRAGRFVLQVRAVKW
jgi:hypothetical protein